jgi:hypothetical protein
MPRTTPSPLSTAAVYDTLREAQAKLNTALQMVGISEQCGNDCQAWRQKIQQLGQALDRHLLALFPDGQRPRV